MTIKELAKQLGYKGCQNCEYQIAPLRSCKWAEQGGDGIVHTVCPMWDLRRSKMNIVDDGRFEIIAKAKEAIIRSTNIETSEDEMKVLDSFLFRCWQMGWLDMYEEKQNDRKEI